MISQVYVIKKISLIKKRLNKDLIYSHETLSIISMHRKLLAILIS